jgi:hypothetical protein
MENVPNVLLMLKVVNQMARKIRASERIFLSFELDDTALQAKLAKLSNEELTKKVYMPALKAALTTIQRRVQSSARSQNLDQKTTKVKNGWTWQTEGRIPPAITVGKRWRVKGFAAGRVFTKTAKSSVKRAPHANPLIAGYRQMVPTGIPGKGQVRFSKMQPARPIYSPAIPEAQRILTDTLKRAIKKLKV